MCVEVLMSVYNGNKYLEEQLESIFSQTVNVHITIRDDGSSDCSDMIIEKYVGINYIRENNVGSTKSFLKLIDLAPDSEYYAFADQDDIWDSNKLESAINSLSKYTSVPAIYCSNTRLVNERQIFIKNEDKKPLISLGSAFVKNYATGCTVVFNRKLMNELKKINPNNIPYHDWWVNLVCLAIGGVSIFDPEPHMNYRQHSENVVSGNSTFMKKWKSRLVKFNKPYHRDNMANIILSTYGDHITDDKKDLLDLISHYKDNKMNIITEKQFATGSIITDLLFKLCVIFNKA